MAKKAENKVDICTSLYLNDISHSFATHAKLTTSKKPRKDRRKIVYTYTVRLLARFLFA